MTWRKVPSVLQPLGVCGSMGAMTDEFPPPPEVTEYFRQIGKKYGAAGGKKSAENLSAAQRKRRAKKASDAVSLNAEKRKERAQKAAAARWGKKKPPKTTDKTE